MNDLFFFIEDGQIANYADDTTYHTIKDSIMELLKTLEKETYTVLNWFSFNEMKSMMKNVISLLLMRVQTVTSLITSYILEMHFLKVKSW